MAWAGDPWHPAERSAGPHEPVSPDSVMGYCPTSRPMVQLPLRPAKPRQQGLTQVLDKGLDLRSLAGVLDDHAPFIDLLKFGWGTALITPRLEAKIALCRAQAVTPLLGGTLFEYCVLTEQLPAFRQLLDDLELTVVEVSNGAGAIDPDRMPGYIRELSADRRVFHEIGRKAPEAAEAMGLAEWIRQMEAGLEAGASLTILEARESGRSGFCDASGEPRASFCQTFLDRFASEALMFEAPTAALQATLLRQFGPQLNLANIAPADVLGLETLRLGLRFDTLAQVPLAFPSQPGGGR